MTAGDSFRRAKRTWSEGVLRTGDRVCILQGVFTGLQGCVVKGYGNGKWVVRLDDFGDCLYLVVTDDYFKLADRRNRAASDDKQTRE
jgi:hypothetical protein